MAPPVQLGGAQCRGQGGGADDAGDHPPPDRCSLAGSRVSSCPAAARATSTRSATHLGVPVRAGPGGAQGPAASSSAARPAGATSPATTAGSSPRSSRRRRSASRRSWPAPRHCAAEGADVIDLGCLPDTPFPHLEEAVQALKAQGWLVSVDSGDPGELRRGARAGADFLLSLTEEHARPRLRDRRRAGADPGPPRRARRPDAEAASGCCGRAGRSWPTRSSTRSISASRPRSCAITSCAAACPRPRC